MQESLAKRIKSAVAKWVQETHQSEAVVVGLVALDETDDEEADRYLVDYAVREIGHWLVAEVWVAESGRVLNINDLGEGLPLDDAAWPWTASGEPS